VTPRSLRRTLSAFQAGYGDPTTKLDGSSFLHATLTPDGPGTLRLRWQSDPAPPADCGLQAEVWGPGRAWLLERVPAIVGDYDAPIDPGTEFPDADPLVVRCLRSTRTTRIGASGNLYHLLLPTILAQRITAGEALRQWQRLVLALGAPAPGPPEIVSGVRLPPAPERLRAQPAWWFHPLGVELKRACALIEVGHHPGKLWEWATHSSPVAAARLARLPGIGAWTIGCVLGPAFGDPDAVPVGDFHLPNLVAWNLAGEPRGDDARMLELLEPYRGQRGRVLAALAAAGRPAPKFGPRQRVVPIARL
jgi:3-methyladenine DNA glycosylase/8-oxoguanine DNA glycosylase